MADQRRVINKSMFWAVYHKLCDYMKNTDEWYNKGAIQMKKKL